MQNAGPSISASEPAERLANGDASATPQETGEGTQRNLASLPELARNVPRERLALRVGPAQ
jgi:hypothetical protein